MSNSKQNFSSSGYFLRSDNPNVSFQQQLSLGQNQSVSANPNLNMAFIQYSDDQEMRSDRNSISRDQSMSSPCISNLSFSYSNLNQMARKSSLESNFLNGLNSEQSSINGDNNQSNDIRLSECSDSGKQLFENFKPLLCGKPTFQRQTSTQRRTFRFNGINNRVENPGLANNFMRATQKQKRMSIQDQQNTRKDNPNFLLEQKIELQVKESNIEDSKTEPNSISIKTRRASKKLPQDCYDSSSLNNTTDHQTKKEKKIVKKKRI